MHEILVEAHRNRIKPIYIDSWLNDELNGQETPPTSSGASNSKIMSTDFTSQLHLMPTTERVLRSVVPTQERPTPGSILPCREAVFYPNANGDSSRRLETDKYLDNSLENSITDLHQPFEPTPHEDTDPKPTPED